MNDVTALNKLALVSLMMSVCLFLTGIVLATMLWWPLLYIGLPLMWYFSDNIFGLAARIHRTLFHEEIEEQEAPGT